MAVTTAAKKKPPSLNHSIRFFSATHSHRSPHLSSSRFLEKPKVEKVKIEGRRCLCKLSTQSSDRDADRTKEESPRSFGEIRDILNDLISRLEFLSIEKKKNPRHVDQNAVPSVDDFSDIVQDKGMDQKKDNLAADFEYASPGSSFAGSSDQLSSSSGVVDHGQSTQVKTEMVGSHAWKRADHRLDAVTEKGCADSRAIEVVDNDEVVLRNDHKIIMKDPRSSYELPANIGKMLFPHQHDGLEWLWSLHCQGKGGILGDDMGLGKTMQIAGYLAGLFGSRLIKRAMIVVPKTLIPRWIEELSVVGLSKMTKS